MEVEVKLTPETQEILNRLQAAKVDLSSHYVMRRARNDIGDAIIKKVGTYVRKRSSHPTRGKGLSKSFVQTYGETQNEVGSDLPYARRREFGFSGQTDSRGSIL